MVLPTSVSVAWEALGRHKLRTALAMLGLIIGVAAVIAMVALGNGAQAAVDEEVRTTGTNLVFVRAGNYTRGGEYLNIAAGAGQATTLTPADAAAIGELEGVEHFSPVVEDRAFVEAGRRRVFAPVHGTGEAFPLLSGWEVRPGRYLAGEEVRSGARVVVLGATVAATLFGESARAVGQTVSIRGESFQVVGVSGSPEREQAEAVFVPYPRLQAMLGIGHLHGVTVAARQAGEASGVAEQITRLLRERHGIPSPAGPGRPRTQGLAGAGPVPDDFTVRTEAAQALTQGLYTYAAAFALASMPRLDEVTSEEMVNTVQQANNTMTALLAGIAAVSLIVGGLGIMNIMMLAVTERTREIGLRISVGARGRDVLLQFLTEAASIGVLGGLLGIAFGFAGAGALTRLLQWPTQVSAGAVALAFGLSVAVGVFFGYYPAFRASRLDPIDALRHE